MADFSASPVTGPSPSFLQSLALPSNIANTQAQTGLMSQQSGYYGQLAAGAGITNQKAAWQLGLLQNLPSPYGSSTPGSEGSPPSGTVGDDGEVLPGGTIDTTRLASDMQSGLAQVSKAPPGPVMDYAQKATLGGMPELGNLAIARYQAGIAQLNTQRAQRAGVLYDQADSVAYTTDTNGNRIPNQQAIETLNRLYPAAAERLTAIAKQNNWTQDQLEQHARDWATAFGREVHQYTGRDIPVGGDGIARDGATNQPLLGGNPAGMSNSQTADLSNRLDALTTVHNSDGSDSQVPTWSIRYRSKEAALRAESARLSTQGSGGTSAPTPATPAAPSAPTAGSLPPGGNLVSAATAPPNPNLAPVQVTALRAGAAPAPAPAPAAPSGPQPQAGVAALAQQNPDPTHMPVIAGRTPSTAAGVINANYPKIAMDMDTEAGKTVGTANAQINGANNAQIALQKAMTGPAGDKVAAFQTLLGNPTSLRALLGDPSSRAVLVKALGNDAVTSLEDEAQGTGMKLGATVLQAALNKLAASADMTPQAITTMTNAIKRNAQWTIQKWGPDYQAYRKAGGDVTKFEGLYNTKYPNQTTISAADLAGSGRQPQPDSGGFIPGKRYTDKNGNSAIYSGNGKWQ